MRLTHVLCLFAVDILLHKYFVKIFENFQIFKNFVNPFFKFSKISKFSKTFLKICLNFYVLYVKPP